MEPDHLALDGNKYQLAHDSLIPKGRRAWTSAPRNSDIADPSVIKNARWNVSGPGGFSREGDDGYLGVDYTENIEHRYDQLLTATAQRNASTLTGSTTAVTVAPTTTPVAAAADWTEVNGGGTDTNVHNELNSYDTPDDTTYWSNTTQLDADNDYLIVGFAPQTDPGVDTGHKLRARVAAPSGNTAAVGVKLRLYDDATVIATSEEYTLDAAAAVALLDTWTIADSASTPVQPVHTVSAGSNRLLLAVISFDYDVSGADNTISGVTYGGEAMTLYTTVNSTLDRGNRRVEIWYLLEAGVAASSGTTFTPTWTGGDPYVDGWTSSVATFSNVNQTTPFRDDASDVEDEALVFTPLTVKNGDYVVSGSVSGWSFYDGSSWTPSSGYTERRDKQVNESYHHLQDKAVTADATETVTATFSSANSTMAGIAVVLQGNASGADVWSNIEWDIPEASIANLSDHAGLRAGLGLTTRTAGGVYWGELQLELPQATVQNIVGINEDRGQLFLDRGQETAQLDPGDMTEVATPVDHGSTVTDSVASFGGEGLVALGADDVIQRRTAVSTTSAATYTDVTASNAYKMAVGPERLWVIWATADADIGKTKFAVDTLANAASFSNPFQVIDPSTNATGLYTLAEYLIAGFERGANSFTSSGKPKSLIQAVKDYPSSVNFAAGDSLWGWFYGATELGLYALDVTGNIANPVGPGEGLRGQRFEGAIDGYPTAVLAYKENLWVAYLTSTGDTHILRGTFGPETADTGRPEWYEFRFLSGVECHALGATTGRDNPTLVVAEGPTPTYYTLGRRGRDIADSNYRFDTGGGTWFGTTMMRTAGMLANIRAARFYTENCDSAATWQLAISVNEGSYVNIGDAVTTNGLQTVRPTSSNVPLSTVHGSYFKPRLTQVNDDTQNPSQIRGFLDVTYDERPETVTQHEIMVVLGQGDFPSEETEWSALNNLLERSQAAARTPFAAVLPGEVDTTYGFITKLSERMDLDGHGTHGVIVTFLEWDVG